MSLYPNKKQIPQQMKISLALTTGFWNELYFYRAKFIITEWSLFVLYTGFSSLGQINLFEVDKLKIDKIFIDDLLNIKKKQNLVKSIIAMAKSLSLTVVAEGIETNEQLLCLKQFGCHLGQGYLLSKPLSVDEIETLLNSSNNII